MNCRPYTHASRHLAHGLVARAARMYRTDREAAEALGVSSKHFKVLCDREGIQTPAERTRQEEVS